MRMSTTAEHSQWLSQVQEPIIDPDREIVDPHHHLWRWPNSTYDLEDLWIDTGSGHNVVQTVYMECGAFYDPDAPEHLSCVGETREVTRLATIAQGNSDKAQIAGIIAHADLRLENLEEVLDAHEAASNGLFRGIRHGGACDPDPDSLTIAGRAPQGLYADPSFRRGINQLGERGLTYDTWHYHHQNRDYLDLVRASPDTTFVLDHFGTPLGVGRFAGKRDEIFAEWKDDIAAIAECPNVFAKLGGLAMPDNGFGWHNRDLPPSSDEFVEAQGRYYDHTIACFGADRCMFESNFPVDRWSIGYDIVWNGFKKLASSYPEADQQMLFSGTARKVYQLSESA